MQQVGLQPGGKGGGRLQWHSACSVQAHTAEHEEQTVLARGTRTGTGPAFKHNNKISKLLSAVWHAPPQAAPPPPPPGPGLP